MSDIDLFTPDWKLPHGIYAAFTGRNGGVSQSAYDSFNLGNHVGDSPTDYKKNRQLLLQSLVGVNQIQWLKQTHGTEIVEACGASVTLQADAVTTTQKGIACAVMTADCLPVLFCDEQGERVAAAHAGWRGLAAGVLLKTLSQFTNPTRVRAYLAPAIGFDAFEVGPEVRDAFYWASDQCFAPGKGDRLFANIYQLAREQLSCAGVQKVSGGQHCTLTEKEIFFSYRRDGVTGRQVSLIWKG